MEQTYMQKLVAWHKRRARVLTLRKNGHSWTDIGKQFGVTPQRARQLGVKAAAEKAA